MRPLLLVGITALVGIVSVTGAYPDDDISRKAIDLIDAAMRCSFTQTDDAKTILAEGKATDGGVDVIDLTRNIYIVPPSAPPMFRHYKASIAPENIEIFVHRNILVISCTDPDTPCNSDFSSKFYQLKDVVEGGQIQEGDRDNEDGENATVLAIPFCDHETATVAAEALETWHEELLTRTDN